MSNKSYTVIHDSIEPRVQKSLDSRLIVTHKEDLCKLETWPHDSYVDENGKTQYTIYMQEGMVVTVTGDKTNPVFDLYILKDLSKILEKDYSGWKFMGPVVSGGNIDGGGANSIYAPGQILYGGAAASRGETDD